MTTTAKSPALAEPAVAAAGSRHGDPVRRCVRCGCRLSAYNTDELCGACSRAALPPAAETPRVPVRVWADPEVREALAAWNFGLVSRLVRQRGSIRQEDVAQLTGLSQGFLSMLESGARRLTSIDRIVDFLDGLAVPAELVRVPRRRPVPRAAPVPLPADRPAALPAAAAAASAERDAPWTAEQAITALTEATAAGGPAGPPRLLHDLCVQVQRWSAAPPYRLSRTQGSGADVPPELIDQLQATSDVLRRLDDEYGGGSLAQSATAHLAVVAGLLRNARYDEAAGRRLAAVAADAAGQAGWYQLDAGRPPAAAQRTLLAGLRAAHASDDPRIGALVLVRLAATAYAAGRPREIVEAVRAGQLRIRSLDAPALRATLLTWEARGHARLGRRPETLRALGVAAELCIRGRGSDEPHWLAGVDEADIHAQAGTCHLDLGDERQAVASLGLAAQTLAPQRVRTRGVVMARTAIARLRLGDLPGAYEAAEQAAGIAARIRSARLDEVVRHLGDLLPELNRRTAPAWQG